MNLNKRSLNNQIPNKVALSLYIMFTWLSFCCGFVLVSTVYGDREVHLFQTGTSSIFQLHSTVTLDEIAALGTKNEGFYMSADLIVEPVWGLNNLKLIKIDLRAPQLHIRSRKSTQDSFIPHWSKLEELSLRPYYILWESGRIIKFLLPNEDSKSISLRNFKRSIASLFQFQLLDLQTEETDSSGKCNVQYESLDLTKIRKIKTDCFSPDVPAVKSLDRFLNISSNSIRRTVYEFNEELNFIKTIYAREVHERVLSSKQDLGFFIDSDQILNHVRQDKCKTIVGDHLENVLNQLEGYQNYDLLTEKEQVEARDAGSLQNAINEFREGLKEKNLGNLASAKAFLNVFQAAKRSGPKDIEKVIKSKKNQKILAQLYDILGYLQDIDIHLILMKHLYFDKEEHQDLSERYLWSLSFAQNPSEDILTDLLDRYKKNPNYSTKVKETLLLTIASMGRKSGPKAKRTVTETVINGLDFAKGEERLQFIRALNNLNNPETVETLLDLARKGTSKEEVLAFEALKSIEPKDARLLQTARRGFFQLDKKYDTSSRTISADILLETQPTDEILFDFFKYLQGNDSSFEIKQYVYQRLQMIADHDPAFKTRVTAILANNPQLNNYAVLSPKGFSTALKRPFLQSPWVNGSLVTVQEMFGGIVKHGIVNVVLEQEAQTKELFSLGIFAGGLTSFVSNQEEGDDEVANAGMQLTVLENQIRPFIFFDKGQTELIGHVWSGTASERTTAFQALILLQDHQELIRLGSGFLVQADVTSGVSFDLAGKIEVSIWSRTADSVVEKSAAILSNGSLRLASSIVTSQVDISASVDPKLHLKSDVDFSGDSILCMRVTRPESSFDQHIVKTETVPGSKHKVRKSKTTKKHIAALTYNLNKKNSDMCSAMFR